MFNLKTLVFTCLSLATPLIQAVEVGADAPICNIKNFTDGTPLALTSPGKVVYVDFWASWCGPCAQSMPFLNELHTQLKARNFEIIAINLDENKEDADAFLEKHPVSFTVAGNADLQCPKSFGVQAMPSSYLIDRRGKIRHVQLGFHSNEADQIRQQVQLLLDE